MKQLVIVQQEILNTFIGFGKDGRKWEMKGRSRYESQGQKN